MQHQPGTVSPDAHLLFGEVVLDEAAHDLLRGPGCADVRGDQAAQDVLCVANPACKHRRSGSNKHQRRARQLVNAAAAAGQENPHVLSLMEGVVREELPISPHQLSAISISESCRLSSFMPSFSLNTQEPEKQL